MAPAEAPIAEKRTTVGQARDVVLAPISDPSLGVIRITDMLFAIGRGEPPFAALPGDIVAQLSRRHARIFIEHGDAWVADLGSKNGTLLNGIEVREHPAPLREGDELSLGGALVYRVRFEAHRPTALSAHAVRTVGVVLAPERTDLGLHELDLSSFPFLISKTDERFARYRKTYPHQVNYISRRHAHIFINDDVAYVEDLGSTNGTFVNGKRLEESAHALHDGDLLAFGGSHFAYRVHLRREQADATLTRLRAARGANDDDAADGDKTTFVAAAHSFLDIFCVDPVAHQGDEINRETTDSGTDGDADSKSTPKRKRGRWRTMFAELGEAFSGDEPVVTARRVNYAAGVLALLVLAGVALYLTGSSERRVHEAMRDARYADAAVLADRYLASHPDDAVYTTVGTEAIFKAYVPEWLKSISQGDFDAANSVIRRMNARGEHNQDATTLAKSLQWITDLERSVVGRGGTDAPIQLYRDELPIGDLVKRWDNDPLTHQRALDRIASFVPAFNDLYADVLSHLRKLQSDNAVYLPAMDRLNSAMVSALAADNPGAVKAALDDAADKYPRLGGLDPVRADLHTFVALDGDLHARKLGALIDKLKTAQFTTPPFEHHFAQMKQTVLPSSEMTAAYASAANAWHAGDSKQAFASLGAIAAPGPWADVVAADIAHKKVVVNEYASLQAARGTAAYQDRLLAFYGNLEPADDVHFVKAVQGDVDEVRDKALAHARDMMARAQAQWLKYRDNGAIGGTQRLESGLSDKFRNQAHLLSDAQSAAQQGMRIFTELNADYPADYTQLIDALDAEVELQRRSLEELRMVLDPGLLKAKLALIGGDGDEARKSP
ncbi:MAG TPA: FHA domain-containing protein [Pararobbsia sp.]|nr:FHA domain-containing protein [Pararobbsia sp.]